MEVQYKWIMGSCWCDMGLTGLWAALQKQFVQSSPDSLMKTVTLICDLNVITNTKISNVKDEPREVKTGVNTHTHTRHPLPLFNAYREKYSRLAYSEHYWQCQHQHQHWHCCFIRPPPPICPVAHANSLILTAAADWCSWVKVHGSWSWRGISLPSLPSQRASWPCQPSLGEIVKTFPFGGVCGAAWNNRYQKPPAWNCPLAPGRVSPVGRDQRETAAIWGLCIQRQLSLLTLLLLNVT